MGRHKASTAPNTNVNATPPAESRRVVPSNDPHHSAGMPGLAICPGCHAIWSHKRWHLDESEFETLRTSGDVAQVLCPADVQIERQEYDGQVTLRSPLIRANHETIVGLIHNTERHLRENNPLSRIAELKVHDDTIEVLTIGTFLAERIGKELRKAYDGQLEIQHGDRARFTRVMWYRD